MPLAPPMRLHVRPGHARTVGAMLVVAALARPAHAQGGAQAAAQPRPAAATSAPTSGTLDGIVFDSLLTGAPLPGAEVWLEGTAHTAITGRGGRFRLADVPTGTHRLTFFHPSLEALGLTPAPRTVAVPGAAPVWLATPSYATVRRARCGAEEDGALLLARVGDDDGAVVPGAQVTVTWSAVGV
ncbi:MAG TPA: carboxypeptidase regulatory-like domain-containing protein, partial [Gemmatirosa sp.]|nr:carboxypeptidase regulatory-like domain-containing protein [Gemmatirosa sp.]